MKIAIVVKQVPDTTSKIVLKPDGSGIDESQFKYVLNPYDEFTVGQALAVKESNAGSELVVFCLGPKSASKTIRDVLAVGADRGVLVVDDGNRVRDPRDVARVLAKVIKDNGFDLVFTGKQAVDDDLMAVPQMIAEALGIPHTSVVSKMELVGAAAVKVERDVEGGMKEVFEMTLPCLVAGTKGLSKMRLASLPGIRAAAKKEIKEIPVDSVGVGIEGGASYTKWELPAERGKCKMIDGEPPEQAAKLARLLREEAKVI